MIASLHPFFHGLGDGLKESGAMLWITWWPLVFGFTLSGLVQSLLPRDALRAQLGMRLVVTGEAEDRAGELRKRVEELALLEHPAVQSRRKEHSLGAVVARLNDDLNLHLRGRNLTGPTGASC